MGQTPGRTQANTMKADSKKTKAKSKGTEAQPAQTSAGNYLRNDQSLVMRSARSDRFTEKFRDGIVHRILNGTTTLAEVREQYFLTEQDLIDWMKQSFDRKQKRIDELTERLRLAESEDKDRILKVESQPRRVTIKGDVIDGRSQSKQSNPENPSQ